MTANPRKATFRECARRVLEQKGYTVEDKGGPGVVPGARLRVSKESKVMRVAVRTSLDRQVGLARNADGSWMTVGSMDSVIVVAPSVENPDCAEVLEFP